MAKHRVMFYHQAGSPSITVETIVTADVDGETLEKRTNHTVSGKPVTDLLAQLITAIDAEIGLEGDDPVTAAKFASVEQPIAENPDQTP